MNTSGQSESYALRIKKKKKLMRVIILKSSRTYYPV